MRSPLLLATLLAFTVPAVSVTGQSDPSPTPASPQLLAYYEVSAGTVQDLQVPLNRSNFSFQVWLGHQLVTIDMSPNDIRAPGFRLLVDDGQRIQQVATPASVTWRGRVQGHAESAVAGTIVAGKLEAVIELSATGTTWGIQSVRDFDPRRPASQHLVFSTRDSTTTNVSCGLKDHAVHQHVSVPNGGAGPDFPLRVAEIAVDADYDFYLKKGSNTTNVNNAVTSVINGMDAIYVRDVEVTYTVTTIIVRSTGRVYSGTNMGSLLQQTQSRWNSAHAGVQRDMTHMFTGKGSFSGVIGIAYLGVVCNLGSAYGVSKAYHNSLTTNVGLVAHECGHNWNSGHCSGGSCYIMCPGLGGCGGNVTRFGTASISAITAFKNSRNCLSSPSNPPTIASVTPNTLGSYAVVSHGVGAPGQSVTITGTNLDTTTSVRFGSQVVTAGILATPTQVVVVPPVPLTLGPAAVVVTNPAANSNVLIMSFTDNSPSGLWAPTVSFSNAMFSMDFGGRASDSWYILMSFNDNTTFPFGGFNILLNNALLSQGTLDSVGIGSYSFQVPNGANLGGLQVYTQLITVDPGSATLRDVTVPHQTSFWF